MGWELTGNELNDPATEYLGTSNNQPLVIRTNGTERVRIDDNGAVRIGTNPLAGPGFRAPAFFAPGHPATPLPPIMLELVRAVVGDYGPVLGLVNRGGGAGATAAIRFGVDASAIDGGLPLSNDSTDWPNAEIKAVNAGLGSNETDLVFSVWAGPILSELLRIQGGSGNVGIGTATPGAKLDVGGNANVAGDLTVTGDVILSNADCAEEFDIHSTVHAQPGMVMVIDDQGGLSPSSRAYDRRVAGVISGAGTFRPAIRLDSQKSSSGRLPVALLGKVYCYADASYGKIMVGDLLTTSTTVGHAMAVDDHSQAVGAVLGKALEPLTSGRGLIPVLVALQ
jgi:hypothetical protein